MTNQARSAAATNAEALAAHFAAVGQAKTAQQPQQEQATPLPFPVRREFAEYMARLPDSGRKKVLKRIREAGAEFFLDVWKAKRESLGLIKPPPGERLWLYQRKPAILWAEELEKFPRFYEEDIQDFTQLEQRWYDGEIEPIAPEQRQMYTSDIGGE